MEHSVTVEDALLSPIGFTVLSGAGLFQGAYDSKLPSGNKVHVHRTSQVYVGADTSKLDLTNVLGDEEQICATAPIFVVEAETDGSVTGAMVNNISCEDGKTLTGGTLKENTTYFVDYYVTKDSKIVDEIQIDAENFGGYYYVEASTLFRRQSDGKDLPAELVFPNVKIQSNFTFAMSSSGDPSTFSFTMDAFPGGQLFSQAA